MTNGQRIYPAADLSEQISTAGKEASGTGNMKFQMNGALTIGTVDGANIEICEEVGVENFFLFGLEAHEVAALRSMGYQPADYLEGNEELQAVIQLIRDGFFSRGNTTQFLPLIDNLIHHDPYFVFADYQSYADCQAQVDQSYRDRERLDAHVHPQRRALGQVLLGSHHPRVLQGDLACTGRARAVVVAGRSEGRPAAVMGTFLFTGDRSIFPDGFRMPLRLHAKNRSVPFK